jgi:UDP-N-acetylglucosamine--N-acetylmuramyl-(pentapeptide) pyrophosphoryl-undecaprenol N-acetylglucosamine transferase
MEMQKVPQAGFKLKDCGFGFARKITLQNMMFPLKLADSLWKAKQIIKELNQMSYWNGWFCQRTIIENGSMMEIPTVIQEQNSFRITNKLLSKKADAICVAYENLDFSKDKMVLTGISASGFN